LTEKLGEPAAMPDTAHLDEQYSDLPTVRERVGLDAPCPAEPDGECPHCWLTRGHEGACDVGPAAPLQEVLDHPELGTPVVSAYGGIERSGIVDEPIPDLPASYTPVRKAPLGVRTVRVVSLASLPPQLNWKSKYEHEVTTFCELTPGNCMEIACADGNDAKRYAKLFSGVLEKGKLRARYRVAGDRCFFWKREVPNTSTSEVPAP
jgi:hypothetical protein